MQSNRPRVRIWHSEPPSHQALSWSSISTEEFSDLFDPFSNGIDNLGQRDDHSL